MDNIYDICGYVAGIFYASSFIPQLYKSYKTKCLDDVSYAWQFIFIIALILSIIYSLHYNLIPIYLTSCIELIMMLLLIFMKYKYSDTKFTKMNDIDNTDNIIQP